jgi:3-hydroxybutyryl-CoA dehydrogenase
MNLLVVGNQTSFEECKMKFGDAHQYTHMGSHESAAEYIGQNDVVFDFLIDQDPDQLEIYFHSTAKIFVNTCKITLSELWFYFNNEIRCEVFGFNGLPTFLERDVLEVSIFKKKHKLELTTLCEELGTDFLIVDDRIGLVTPRIVCMIINEAYYTVQEGTASKADIDLGMKLGTNYPFGPFEWCTKIGVDHVYELLEAVYEDTKDERYKICPLLKKEYLLYSV